ncbi:hypothetical protein B0T26DRAFT_687899 [Lasiosphaeria miniovina]|uniref:Uncharacterized protein n=1 Tax=Lasiosphaeria miniovina TaxID=1954250 RepID=A0AA40EAD0_9PEZI|nr:uncharacterized protein B0T26DRAFT_687899 [Lasiosphaeria miniovina]KAK0734269.1 hypothetical protein B0T26DRAFT_687899 [Lasiosphaeria miniovina]
MFFSRTFYCFVLFYLIVMVKAYTVFNPECSRPTTSYNFVLNPDFRGTLDILWSSLFTVFACTWTIQHPNVPEQRRGRYPGWKGDLRWGLRGFWTSIKLAFSIVIAPEIIITIATSDFILARLSFRDINAHFKEDNVPWTLSHSHFADMGGFVIRVADETEAGLVPDSKISHHNPYHLSAADILDLRREGHIRRLPSITEEELHDRSKADPALKAIAVTQIFFSMLQVTIRACRQLTISLLELSVLAFAACAIAIYALYWKKPKSVLSSVTILEYKGSIPPDVFNVLQQRKIKNQTRSMVRVLFPPGFSPLRRNTGFPGEPFCNTGSKWTKVSQGTEWIFRMSGLGAAMIFGGVHVAGWNFVFPTRAEQIAWRTASLYTAAFGVVIYLLSQSARAGYYNVMQWGKCVASWIYLFSRLFILVEIFRTLFFLPPDVYVSTWTLNIPHFS